MVIYRTFLFYFALIAVIRGLGKRQVGQMEPSEFVVTMLIANLASVPLEDWSIPVWGGLVPMGIVFLCERTLSWLCLKSIRLRRFFCGKPVILIENGRLLAGNLRRTRVNLDELSGHLRQQGVLDMKSVQFAILETNGTVTVFPYPPGKKPPELPYTVISDGRILRGNLRLLGFDEALLHKKLRGRGLKAEQVLLMTLTASGECAVFPRE
ncbi:MAG: DUF421 domain-containing protein [Oscillospiraceae bacterium]|nr:DUF421 domain-containing protein [Oscillospiraceae bacterium]